MTGPVLELCGVSAGYGGHPVLRGIGLDVARGEAVAVLGRNGAGKTTLLHALFNLGPRVRGGVRVMGQDVSGWPTHRVARLGMALVPQNRGAFPELTVAESLRLSTVRKVRGSWTLDRVFATFPRLAERRRASCSALSGGERQMLAVGRALMTQPSVLLLDEPSEGMAPRTAEEVLCGVLCGLVADGLTVLLAEQNVSLALQLCPRGVVLANGTAVFDGSAPALLADRALLAEHLGV